MATRKDKGKRNALVKTEVESVGPGDYTDAASRGLQLRVRKTTTGLSRSWLFRYKWAGTGVRIVLGHFPSMSLADAREAAQHNRDLIRKGIDPRKAERTAPSLARTTSTTQAAKTAGKYSIETLADEFMRLHVEPGRKQPAYVKRILDKEILSAEAWAGRDARTIKPREVVELLDGIVTRGSRVMANRVAGILSQMFRFGIHRAIVETSPVQLLYRPGGKERPRERSLDDAELALLLANLEPIMGVRSIRMVYALRLLLLTGQRRGELSLARWSDVHLKGEEPHWTIPAENSKTGVKHDVPLSPWAIREFENLRKMAGRSPYVWANETGDGPSDGKILTRSVARYRTEFEAVGLQAWTPHDLRRSCRTGLARLNVRDEVAERVLNHALPGMRGVYNRHTYLPEMREALNKWATHLEGLVK